VWLLKEQLIDGAWQGAHETRAQIITAQLYVTVLLRRNICGLKPGNAFLMQLHVVHVQQGISRERAHGARGPLSETTIGALGRERAALVASGSTVAATEAAYTVAATEAAGTPTARFALLPISSLEELVQPLNKGCIKNLVVAASSNLYVALDDSKIRHMALRAPPGGVKGRSEK
jgi:hypothetical protein